MDTREFIGKIKRLHKLQAVTVKFNKQDGIVGLIRLNALVKHSEGIHFDRNDEIVVMAVLSSRDWGGDHNRSVTVWGLSQGDESMLAGIARDIELLVQPDHPAKGITAKREKSRQQALDELRDAIMPVCTQEADEWGLDLEFGVVDQDGFVVACFMVKHGDTAYCSVGIDGWSGRLLNDLQLGDELYTGPEQIQQRLGEAILDVADMVTS